MLGNMKNYFFWLVTVLIIIVKEGKSNQSIMERFADGEIAKYQVSVRLKKRDKPFGRGHICGGCAISDKTILTAARCLWEEKVSPDDISVVTGSTKLNDRSPPTLIFDIRGMNFHRRSKSGTNDVGLLFLKGVIPVGHPTAQPIPIASSPLQEGRNCRVSGWGRISPDETSLNDLLIINVRPLVPSTCNNILNEKTEFYQRNGMFCTKAEDEKECKVDSGRPLVCGNEVVGIVSSGIEYGAENHLVVYTDVYYNRDWILENSAHSINLNFVNFKIASLLNLLIIVEQ